MRAVPLAALALWPVLMLGPARAGEVMRDAGVRGGFQGLQGLACVVAASAAADPAKLADLGGQPCMHIGSVSVGQAVAAIEQVLGAPFKTIALQAGVEARAYALAPASPSAPFRPYYVVSYRGGWSIAVQVTGPPTADPVRFTTLALGDSEAVMVARLGNPMSRQPVPQIPGAVLWRFGGADVSVEIKDGVIYSMRVAYSPPNDGS